MTAINLMNVEEIVDDAVNAIDGIAVCDEQAEAFAEEMMDIIYDGGSEEQVRTYIEALARDIRAEDFCCGDEPISTVWNEI
jgi:hypothetical protein